MFLELEREGFAFDVKGVSVADSTATEVSAVGVCDCFGHRMCVRECAGTGGTAV
jgi:hypothetical protein